LFNKSNEGKELFCLRFHFHNHPSIFSDIIIHASYQFFGFHGVIIDQECSSSKYDDITYSWENLII